MFANSTLPYTGQQLTQRKMLPIAAFLFDQVKVIAIVCHQTRMQTSENNQRGKNCDQPVSECFQQEPQEGSDSMLSILFSRCLIPNIKKPCHFQMFSDAKLSAIAAIVYVRPATPMNPPHHNIC